MAPAPADRRATGTSRDGLLARLAPVVTVAGYDLEDVSVTAAGKRSLVRVIVDADRASVSVLVYPDVLEGATGRVVFEQAGQVQKLELQPVEGAVYLMSELEGLDEGPFSIRLELSAQ